jgi:hypothetical protein
MKIEGGCLCGKVRYSADTEPAFVGVCHCKNCQKQAGTAFSVIMGIPAAALSVEGELKTYEVAAIAGRPCCDGSARIAVRRSPATPQRSRA